MTTPHETAAEAVEFWQAVADIFGIEIRNAHEGELSQQLIDDGWFFYDGAFGKDPEFTRDMLARCVLWLAERRAWVAPLSTQCVLMVESQWRKNLGDCIITAHRDAVLAVAKETK